MSWQQVTPDVLLEDRAGNRVAIPTFELGRFYCGLVPDLLDTFFESGMTPEGSMELLFNPEKTEIVGRRLEIAPRRSFCSVSAILQIAMAISDREILFHFQRGLAQMKEQLRVNDAWPFLVVPILPMDLTLEGRSFPFSDPVTGASVRVFAAMRVVSDLRDRSVDEIVVHYPFALFPRRLESRPDDENLDQTDDRLPVIFGPDTEIGRRLLPGKRTVFVPSLFSRFTTSAPRWRKTSITYAYREPSVPPGEALPPRTRTGRGASEAPEASISQATSQGAVPQARNRTMRERRYAYKPEERDRVASEFLKGLPAETLTSERIEASSSPKAFRVFLEAGVELFEWQDTRLSPNIAGEVGEGTAMVLPESWGGIAGSTRARAPRRIIALPLLIGSVFVWTVEIERRAHYEKMSVGLFASQRGDMDPLDLLNSVMYKICRRTARKQDREHLGLWPNADYLDVRLMSLTHAPLRRYPQTLAADLLDRAIALVSASRSP